MLKRKSSNILREWKEKKDRKSLIINGARQIGKTTAVRNFAGDAFDNIVELNFIERPELKDIFSDSLNVDDLILNIQLYFDGTQFAPGKTLIFLDEIQECERAIASLKFWTLDRRYHVIATGSALGMNYNRNSSYPVGQVDYYEMHSMDFEEFLWAKGVGPEIISKVRHCLQSKSSVPTLIHKKMSDYLKEYMCVGGMPEVVNEYVMNRNIENVDKIQKRLFQDYIYDIARYAPSKYKIKAEQCFKSIIEQLSKENHKFQYSRIEHNATATKFETSLDWLKNAFMTVEVKALKSISYPLEGYVDETNFRIYNSDIGMLMAQYNISVKKALLTEEYMEGEAKNVVLGTVKGAMYEALAADMLCKNNHQLYFYKDVKSTSEIEFIIYGQDGVLPIEIKASKKKANSLGRILEKDNIAYGYKMSSQNVGVSGKKVTMPMYMLAWV